MSKKKQSYWRRRAIQNEKDWNKRCQETVEKRLGKYYSSALKAIRDDILKLYGSFAKENGMDFDEARRFLSSREFREWRMSIHEYLQKISGNDKGLSRELSEFEARLRITRLEKLYSETLQELDNLGRNVDKSLRDFLSNAYTSNYQRDIFDLVKTGGLSVAIAKVDSHDLSRVMASRWSGKSFSTRVWNNTTLLSRSLRTVIANGVHRGLSIDRMSQMIEDKMHAGYSNAVRLVRTEMNFVNNQAHADSMKDAEVEYYEFIAVLDNRTSQRCRALDGEVYLLAERDVGANYPPMHARCRSTVAPFIEGVSRRGTRVAKDRSGRNIDIPAAMTYRDYESVYIKKEKTLATWREERSLSDLPKGLAASDVSSLNGDLSKPIKVGEITDSKYVRPTLEYFEKQIASYSVENAIIITESNEVYRCVGDKEGITSIAELGSKLRGACVTHNHPINSSNEYSFSRFDIDMFMDYGLKILRGIDDKFVYELNRNSSNLDSDDFSIGDLIENPESFISRHIVVIKIAKELGIGYRRWSR